MADVPVSWEWLRPKPSCPLSSQPARSSVLLFRKRPNRHRGVLQSFITTFSFCRRRRTRPAAIDDKIDEDTSLRTGNDSRSELAFADLTLTRLGSNTIFSVNNAGRSVHLDAGSILLYAKKSSGEAHISTSAVSVAISGTTVIFESQADSYDRLTVLEGSARFSFNNFPEESTEVHAGQLLNVNAGAKKLPKPGRVDLRRIMRTHPLIKNFPPLPSLDLIAAEMRKQNPNLPIPRLPSGVGTGGNVNLPPPGPPPTLGGYPGLIPSPRRPSPTPRPTVVPTPTATVKPTPRPTPKPTPRPTFSPKPSPKPTFTPRRPLRPPKKPPTPTPKPSQIIR